MKTKDVHNETKDVFGQTIRPLNNTDPLNVFKTTPLQKLPDRFENSYDLGVV